jgi:hypothetical protein
MATIKNSGQRYSSARPAQAPNKYGQPHASVKVQRALDQLAKEYDRNVDDFIATMRKKYLIPFCNKHGLQFAAGNGNWGFTAGGEFSGCELNSVPALSGGGQLERILRAEVDAHNDVGSLMERYSPPTLGSKP